VRRLVPIVVALALLVAAGAAEAAHPLQVVNGSAHGGGELVKVSFVVRNVGAIRSPRTRATVIFHSGRRRVPLRRPWIGPLAPGERHRVAFTATLPPLLPAGTWAIRVCIARRCNGLGSTSVGQRDAAAPTSGPQSPPAAQPISTVPIPHPVAEPFFHAGGGAEYWGFIPRSYDATNQTPTTLFVWLHGCGGEAEGDAWVVDPGAEGGVPQDWMTLSLGGRDGGCWNPLAETEPLLMAAIADFETHFNVNRRRVILGGYSSGGDLAYRTAFKHSSAFAGLLIENSAPFRDTEASEAELLGAATTKFPIVHLAHEQDMTYKLGEVEPEIAAVRAAGFPVELVKRPGEHWNEPGDVVAGHPVPGTDADILTYLLPHIDDGRLAPAP
jgi:pimeloyl-ACP methyl ester carboxylesterase